MSARRRIEVIITQPVYQSYLDICLWYQLKTYVSLKLQSGPLRLTQQCLRRADTRRGSTESSYTGFITWQPEAGSSFQSIGIWDKRTCHFEIELKFTSCNYAPMRTTRSIDRGRHQVRELNRFRFWTPSVSLVLSGVTDMRQLVKELNRQLWKIRVSVSEPRTYTCSSCLDQFCVKWKLLPQLRMQRHQYSGGFSPRVKAMPKAKLDVAAYLFAWANQQLCVTLLLALTLTQHPCQNRSTIHVFAADYSTLSI
jgi:hypothetical protein